MKNANKERFYEAADRHGYWSWVETVREADGTILGVMVHSKDEDGHFDELTAEEQEKAIAWIKANVICRETPLDGHTSYGMKHVLEHRTNIYMTNNQFKEAMLLCGFYPVTVDELNWHYCISRKSPIFRRQEDGRDGLLIRDCVMHYAD